VQRTIDLLHPGHVTATSSWSRCNSAYPKLLSAQ